MFKRNFFITALTCLLALYPGWVTAGARRLQFRGKDFFVIGLYDWAGQEHQDQTHFPEIAKFCNTVHFFDHNAGWGHREWLTKEILDSAEANGLAVVDALYTYNYHGRGNPDNWLYQDDQRKIGSLFYLRLQEFKDHPALFMWETMDETGAAWHNQKAPQVEYYWPTHDQFVAAKSFIHQYGGGKPVWYNEGPAYFQNSPAVTIEEDQSWAQGCDVYSQDIYPNPHGGDSDEVKRHMDFVHDVVGADAPQFIVLNCGDDWPYAEMAYMVYTAIIHGANGIWWWGGHQTSPFASRFQNIQSIGSQLKTMHDALAGRDWRAYRYYNTLHQFWDGTGIACSSGPVEMLKISTGDSMDYLICANTSRIPAPCKIISVAGWHGDRLFRGPVGGANHNFGEEITFGPHEVAVYQSRAVVLP